MKLYPVFFNHPVLNKLIYSGRKFRFITTVQEKKRPRPGSLVSSRKVTDMTGWHYLYRLWDFLFAYHMKPKSLNQLVNEAAIAVKSANRNRAVARMHEIEQRFVPNWRRGPRDYLWYVLYNINTWNTPPPSPNSSPRRKTPSPPRRNSPSVRPLPGARRRAAASKIQSAWRRYKKRTRSPKTTKRIPRTNL